MNLLESMGWPKKLSNATVPLIKPITCTSSQKKIKSPETIPFKKIKTMYTVPEDSGELHPPPRERFLAKT